VGDLATALRNADAAGDVEAATRIAAMIKSQQAVRSEPSPAPTQIQEPIQESPSFIESAIGGGEGALQLVSGAIAEPIAGIAGIAGAINPFAGEGESVRAIDATREMLTYQPRTRSGQGALRPIGEVLEPLAGMLEELKTYIGDDAFNATGSPALAAISTAIPEAMIELLGAGTARRAAKQAAISTPKKIAKDASINAIESSEDATGIGRLTSDVLPPESRTGKFLQQQAELIKPSQRVTQQQARIKSIDNALTEFDVIDGARYEAKIVEGLKATIGSQKKAAGLKFERVVSQLDGFGDVPISKTKKLAQQVIDKEVIKGTLADQSLISQMMDFVSAPDELRFSDVKSIRSTIGNNLQKAKALAPVVGTSDTGLLSQMYKELSNDMSKFAFKNDKGLAKEWRLADKEFSDFATGANKAGVKAAIKRGDATPEVVDQLLFSTKPSDVDYLVNNLDQTGKQATKQRLLQKFLEKSAPDGESFSPNKFATQLSKFRMQVGKVFTGDERKAIEGLRDALNQTRRAQDSAATTVTGQQLVPMFAMANPAVLIPGLAQAFVESKAIRNLLVRRKAAKTQVQRTAIDAKIKKEIDRAGLVGAATTGAIPKEER